MIYNMTSLAFGLSPSSSVAIFLSFRKTAKSDY